MTGCSVPQEPTQGLHHSSVTPFQTLQLRLMLASMHFLGLKKFFFRGDNFTDDKLAYIEHLSNLEGLHMSCMRESMIAACHY